MKLLQISLLACATLLATSCQSKVKKNTIPENTENTEIVNEVDEEVVKLSPQQLSKYETAYFASGCFWCNRS